ncbi:MAG: trigger factor [Burkholderiales bacterium]|jgi:trigger factor|nr:trigger factor [Burkholderiales bacterium]
MQTTIETISQLERRMTFGLPKAGIDADVSKKLKNLAKKVKLAGFRPGKVPMKVVEQQYGASVQQDVLLEHVQKRFAEIAEENQLRLAASPQVAPKAGENADNAEEIVFEATFEVYPEVHLPDITQIELKRPTVDIKEADLEKTLETLRKQRTTFNAVTRPSQSGDRVVCDYVGTIDGVAFAGGQGSDMGIVIGANNVLPEFEKAVTGASTHEEKTFPLTFPEDYHGRDVAGKTAEFKVTVKSVSEPVLPPLDEAFARSLGIEDGSLEKLRDEVKKNLLLQLKHKTEALVKEQVIAAIRDGAETLIPKSMVTEEIQRMARQMADRLKHQGVKEQDIKLTPEMFREQAEKSVRLALVLGEAIRANHLQPKDEDVRALVAEMAQTYDDPEAVIRWHYEHPERLSRFTSLAAERNLVLWAERTAKVTDHPMTLEDAMKPDVSLVAPQTADTANAKE